MGSVETKSLSQEIYSRLKWEILNMTIKPGAFITEQNLARQYQMSKTPVREALNRLAADELVTVLPHKGYVVTEISYGELLEIFQFREILEVAAVELAMQRITKEQLEQLKELSEEMPEVNFDNGYIKVNTPVNDRFHSYLVSISNNSLFMQTHARVMEKLYRVLLMDTQESKVHAIRTEHMELVALMIEGNKSGACDYMREHIRRTKDRVLKR
ncbi:MAG: GntR family transcriptional regulator [Lachnospiraceae bacterium]|nr:GntR family transcriptional regulator [Lachnospiraceae bacterium]